MTDREEIAMRKLILNRETLLRLERSELGRARGGHPWKIQ